MLVEVYRNIRARNWSVRDARTKKVIAHTPEVALTDVVFKVSEAGRQRVLREHRKNVHAWVRGTLVEQSLYHWNMLARLKGHPSDLQIVYGPYKMDWFSVVGTGARMESARLAVFTTAGLYVMP